MTDPSEAENNWLEQLEQNDLLGRLQRLAASEGERRANPFDVAFSSQAIRDAVFGLTVTEEPALRITQHERPSSITIDWGENPSFPRIDMPPPPLTPYATRLYNSDAPAPVFPAPPHTWRDVSAAYDRLTEQAQQERGPILRSSDPAWPIYGRPIRWLETDISDVANGRPSTDEDIELCPRCNKPRSECDAGDGSPQ